MRAHLRLCVHLSLCIHTRTANAAFALVSELGQVTEALEWEEAFADEEKVACGWSMGQDGILYPHQR